MSPKYEQRAVLFLDVLGFKSLIDAGREDLIEEALAITSAKYQSNYEVSAFSDNMVVSIGFGHGYELAELIQFSSYLTLSLLHLGVLSRGGITIGKLRHNKNIVYGPALIEAYHLESQVANYPRIVLAKDTVENSLKLGGNPQGCEDFIRGFLRTDSDGLEHVHIMDHKALMPFHKMISTNLQQPGTIPLKNLADAKSDAIERALDSNPPIDPRAVSKHEWLRQYAEEYKCLYANA